MTITLNNETTDQRAATSAPPAPPAPPSPVVPSASNPEHIRPSALRKLLRDD